MQITLISVKTAVLFLPFHTFLVSPPWPEATRTERLRHKVIIPLCADDLPYSYLAGRVGGEFQFWFELVPIIYSAPLSVVPYSGLSHFCHSENVINRDVT